MNLINRTKVELVGMVENLQAENTELKIRLKNPNAEQIAEYKDQAQVIQTKIEEIRRTDPNSNEVHNLASKKSRINSFVKVLGGEAVHVGNRRGGIRRSFTPDEMQEKIVELLQERVVIQEQDKVEETLKNHKRKASITSELSKWRKKLKDLDIEPVASLEEARAMIEAVDEALDNEVDDLGDEDENDDWDDDDDDDWDDSDTDPEMEGETVDMAAV